MPALPAELPRIDRRDLVTSYQEYWDGFYSSRTSQAVPLEPSTFAKWVHGRLPHAQPVADVGFGNARDSLWFARQGRKVKGFDFAVSAIRQARARASAESLSVEFAHLDLYDEKDAAAASRSISSMGAAVAIYGRFLLHALEESGRRNFFELASSALGQGGQLFLEFRTGRDAETRHVFGEDHFRVYLDEAAVAAELKEHGAIIVEQQSGHGFAVYKHEDPHVARVVAAWA